MVNGSSHGEELGVICHLKSSKVKASSYLFQGIWTTVRDNQFSKGKPEKIKVMNSH